MSVQGQGWQISSWVLLIIATVLILYLWGTRNFKRFSNYNIPYIKPLPFIGTMRKPFINKQPMLEHMLDMYQRLDGNAYGGVFVFTCPSLMLRDPELIKTVAIKDFDNFTDHRSFLAGEKDDVWARGLDGLKGQRWREMRTTLSPAFTSSKMKTIFVLISECCQQLVEYLEQCYIKLPPKCVDIKKDGDVLVLELKKFYTRYTSDVIATTAFGIGVDSLREPTNDFYMMGQKAVSFNGIRALKWFASMAAPNIMKMLKIRLVPKNATDFFRSLIHEAIETREREGIVRPDMLQLLIQTKNGSLQDENSGESSNGSKIKVDNDDILGVALGFFLAGFDSVSTVLCFVSHQLAVHPDVQTRLQQEVDRTLQENNGEFTYDAINNMKYMEMVLNETLRLYPHFSVVDRVCVKNYTLKTHPPVNLKVGDNIIIPIVGLHRDPKYYPDPYRFDPERFSDENKHKINPMTFMPFGVGPRICTGKRMALMEIKLVLANILSKLSFKVVSETPIHVKLVQSGFSKSIKGGFHVGLEKRSA